MENIRMAIPKLTGNMLRAARSLCGITRDQLATQSGLSRDVLRSWEVSSDHIIPAQYVYLCKATEALEAEGIRFSDGGDPRRRDGGVRSHSSSGSENLIFSLDFRLKIHGGCLCANDFQSCPHGLR
jgi:hypothetical protein